MPGATTAPRAPLVVLPAVLAVYAATGARLHPPDAVAYTRQVTLHLPVEPEHMLHPWVGRAAVGLGRLVGLAPEGALGLANGLAGAIACALVAALVERASGRRWLGLALGLGVAGTWTLWHQATTWEAHALPTAALLGVAWLIATARPAWLVGLALGGAGLLHLVAALAAPGAALAAWRRSGRARDGLVVLGLGASVVAVGLLLVLGPEILAAPAVGPAPGEPEAGAPSTRLHSGLRHLVAWVGPARCGGEGPAAGLLGGTSVDLLLATGLVGVAVALLLARRRLAGQAPLALYLGTWPLLALPAVAWFEPDNSEYLLGPALALATLGGLAAGLSLRRPLHERALAGLLLALGLVVGMHDWRADIGPAHAAPAHAPCRAAPDPPAAPPPTSTTGERSLRQRLRAGER